MSKSPHYNQQQTEPKQCKSEKLGLFGLHSYANIDIVEIFYVLGSRHLRHDKVTLLNIYKETF